MPPVSDNPVVEKTNKFPTKQLKPFVIVIALILLAAVAAVAAIIIQNSSANPKQKVNQPATSSLKKDRVFVRYETDAAYEKDDAGNIKELIAADGATTKARKETFEVTLEKNGITRHIALDKKVIRFGTTSDNDFYALSCTVVEFGKVGGDNVSFIVQFYDQDGNKTRQATWKQQDTIRPVALGESCDGVFVVNSSNPLDFAARGYGRELVDDINYKIVFVKADGSKQDVDTETTKDIDILLGPTPDKKLFLYNRVSAKRTSPGCGGEVVDLAYKIPDFSGPINELHVVDLATGKDTMLGTEKSFSAENHAIDLSQMGKFSSDSGRYYLIDVGSAAHSGCSDAPSVPIRIPYIDLKTNKFETIISPTGREYSKYCFTSDGKFVLEYGVVDDYDDATPAKTLAAPTVLNTSDSSVYQSDNLTKEFECTTDSWLPGTFMTLNKTGNETKKEHIYTLKGLTTFNPATKVVQKTTLKTPVLRKSELYFNNVTISPFDVFKTNTDNVGYINTQPGDKTVLFNALTGETQEVDHADLVL